jgi:hypothetical protein
VRDSRGNTHAEECAIHEDVSMLGEPACLERAVVGLLELAGLALAPALRHAVRAWDSVQRRTEERDTVGAVERERAKRAGNSERECRRGRALEREREDERGRVRG